MGVEEGRFGGASSPSTMDVMEDAFNGSSCRVHASQRELIAPKRVSNEKAVAGDVERGTLLGKSSCVVAQWRSTGRVTRRVVE